MKEATNSTWLFRDFIEKCVIHQFKTRGVSGMNEHYRPQSVAGAFCDVQYNFIGKSTLEYYLTRGVLYVFANCKIDSQFLSWSRKNLVFVTEMAHFVS